MFLSTILYCGAVAILIGTIALLPRRTRHRAVWLILTGVASITIAIFYPASEQRVTSVATNLDKIMPRWQFDEHHEIQINATPERIYAAIRDVTPREIRLFQTLTTIRCLGRCKGESILNAPDAKPILEVATSSGFRILADDPPRELVIGTRVAPRTVAVMNFLVGNDGHVTTETRVFAQTERGARKFAVYWRIIRPGSGIIRRSWLEAIKRRAEAKP
ncbi:MAG: hypothetical protein QOC81_4003 [Thermoanaerobaculia bacterium]|jgi:hypothetical protein|nr:hypothetical protein [Thermoanaerobaculia bacterium]